jgi:hypothetical protein
VCYKFHVPKIDFRKLHFGRIFFLGPPPC